MFKKVLFIIGSFILGFLLIITVTSSTIVSVSQKLFSKALEEDNHTEIKRFFFGLFDITEGRTYIHENKETGERVEVFYGLMNESRSFVKKDGETTSYDSIGTGVEVFLYKLPETFKLEDAAEKQGGVRLVYEGTDQSLFFPFKTEMKNAYEIASLYNVLAFNIQYKDYVAKVNADLQDDITLQSKIISVEILDGEEDVKYQLSTPGLTFDNPMHKEFDLVLQEYYQAQEASLNGEDVSKDKINEISDKYNKLITNNENYISQRTTEEIIKTADFIVPVVIAAVIFIALDILVAWFIFRKKKPAKYIPPYQKTAQTTQTQPEQFNRNVFDVEEYDEVEEITETEGKPTSEE